MLSGVFGPKRDEVTGEWKKLHNEELNDLYFSPNIIQVIKTRKIRWAGHLARTGRGEVHTVSEYRVSVWKSDGKRTLGRPKQTWEDNIIIDHQEVGCGRGLD